MAKIIQLSDDLSNKIAAGEVVERPASVVKELVENAIDAKSTVIEIDVEEAGLSSIRIIDNGVGIDAEDCKLAFQRHATSKIKDENDLFRVRTLGFRGEALPSIASVSHLEMKTSTGEGAGTHLALQGGKIISEKKTSGRRGTEIVVTNLFYNTPARLKYMKTVHTELGNISDVVNRIALAHPEVSIRLRHQGKVLLQTNGNGDVRHVLAAIYGTAVAKKMLPLHVQSLDFEVKGYISLPEVTETIPENERVPVMYPIGQMHGTYILAQNERGLYIIDQHAAQERIKYEYYREKVGEIKQEVQEMLVPLTFHYSKNDMLIIEEHKDILAKVGVFLEPFGSGSYIVRSHPQWFPKGEEAELIEEIIEQVLDEKRVDIKKLREEAAIMMSCKGSIKANRHLRHDEIKALLDELRQTKDPFTCPHGRPIIIHHSTYEMEKMFKRVM
ncbi:DNA mismatch repair endonuclease MutL [Bacillus safensis]|uniref:DNA mismatch repair endonuclease MutL n=1 Tax=Bacillus safensis TaxID=561879 RepID=UPI0022817604|nr:DNA mismatch repair endonuclease MutL [Bacillus safensis]MCY7663414.1 DNA mismatch repair endonuclease MutL [Bacillus safensis]